MFLQRYFQVNSNLESFWVALLIDIFILDNYRISANSFRGNYSFLNLALFTVTFDLYYINLNSCRGNYSREETIQGRKLFAEIRYLIFKVFILEMVSSWQCTMHIIFPTHKEKTSRKRQTFIHYKKVVIWLH